MSNPLEQAGRESEAQAVVWALASAGARQGTMCLHSCRNDSPHCNIHQGYYN